MRCFWADAIFASCLCGFATFSGRGESARWKLVLWENSSYSRYRSAILDMELEDCIIGGDLFYSRSMQCLEEILGKVFYRFFLGIDEGLEDQNFMKMVY